MGLELELSLSQRNRPRKVLKPQIISPALLSPESSLFSPSLREKIKEAFRNRNHHISPKKTLMSLTTIHGGSTTAVSAISSSSSSSATACAACKYQRKKCTRNCLLAPYFPQKHQKQFLNAHRLFGVSNITKMIKGVQESQRDIAMHNLIFHANARALDPVGGVYRIMCDLKHKIECYQAELNLVHQQLAMYRSLAQQQQRQRQDLPFGCYSYGDMLEQENEYVNVNEYDHQNLQLHQEIQQQQCPLNYEMFLELPEQTNKVKLEKEEISDPEQNNLLSQILTSS